MWIQDEVAREAGVGGGIHQLVWMQKDNGAQSAFQFPFDDLEDLPTQQSDAETRSVWELAVEQ